MSIRSASNHGSSFPSMLYFYIALIFFVFALISFIKFSIPLGIVSIIVGIFLLHKSGFINLSFFYLPKAAWRVKILIYGGHLLAVD